MRAQFIYEKFTEEGDPIKDLDIGVQHYDNIQHKFYEELEELQENFENFLKRSFEGKYVTAEIEKCLEGQNTRKKRTIKVKEIGYCDIETDYVIVDDEKNEEYQIDLNQVITVCKIKPSI